MRAVARQNLVRLEVEALGSLFELCLHERVAVAYQRAGIAGPVHERRGVDGVDGYDGLLGKSDCGRDVGCKLCTA
jgi:hypothetical protein